MNGNEREEQEGEIEGKGEEEREERGKRRERKRERGGERERRREKEVPEVEEVRFDFKVVLIVKRFV